MTPKKELQFWQLIITILIITEEGITIPSSDNTKIAHNLTKDYFQILKNLKLNNKINKYWWSITYNTFVKILNSGMNKQQIREIIELAINNPQWRRSNSIVSANKTFEKFAPIQKQIKENEGSLRSFEERWLKGGTNE